MANNNNKITIHEFCNILETMSQVTDFSNAFHVLGPSGVGKTTISKRFGDRNDMHIIEIQTSVMTKKDIYNIINKNHIKKEKLLIILNEFNHMDVENMSSLYELISENKIDDIILPKQTTIIATSNRQIESKVSHKILGPLQNRFNTYIIEPSLEDYIIYAKENNYHQSIIDFLLFNPKELYKYTPSFNQNNFPSPRAWEKVNQYITKGIVTDINISKSILSSMIGEITAELYIHFCQYIKALEVTEAYHIHSLEYNGWNNPFPDLEDIEEIIEIFKYTTDNDRRDVSYVGILRRKMCGKLIHMNIVSPDMCRNKYINNQKIEHQENL